MANTDYEKRGSGQFTAIGNMTAQMHYFDDIMTLAGMVWEEGPDNDIYVGMGILVEEEILRLTEIISMSPDQKEMAIRVARGCADTRPWILPQGADVWFYDDATGTDGMIYAGGEEGGVKVLPWTHNGGVMEVEDSPPLAITYNWRYSRPYLPGLMQHSASNEPWFERAEFGYDDGGLALKWAHRDRILQSDQLIDHHQGNIGPEPGATYKARIYNEGNDLLRTEVGITGTTWTYPWAQAMGDFGMVVGTNQTKNGFLEFMAYRQGLDSWQYYRIPFTIIADGPEVFVAMLGEQVMVKPVEDGPDEDPAPINGAMIAALGQQVMQQREADEGEDPGGVINGAMVAHLREVVKSADTLFAPLHRIWFEAPHTFLVRRYGMAPLSARIVSGVARSSDRLTDSHSIWSKSYNPTAGEFEKKGEPNWCPWATLARPIEYFDEVVDISKTSLVDGVSLDGVRPGQLALLGIEVVIVKALDQVAMKVTIGRGAVDTIPWRHGGADRIWFFEADCGVNDGPFVEPTGDTGRITVDNKAVPKGYGGYEAPERKLPSDRLYLANRKFRPFPPGRLQVNGRPWFEGLYVEKDRSNVFTLTQRNRLTQGANLYDHHHDSIPFEPGTTYVFNITISYYKTPLATRPTVVVVRNDMTVGTRYEYTWEMAARDSATIQSHLKWICGRISTVMRVSALRDGMTSWQSYTVPLSLPAGACGWGQRPGNTGGGGWQGGNGGNNHNPGEGGGNRPPRPEDPFDNGSGNDGDSGYPGGSNPGGEGDDGMYWDYNWDEFWAARRRDEDDIGE